ncbi:MAG: type II toxin-antitoxin system VapC family toxin [Gammaproteobacteria bacterium]|nr:type II toxin-antitoxin system VapC family toxin [Gammaproteobacteria bacterium]
MNGYLLDTHVVLWLAASPEQLSEPAKEVLLDSSVRLYASIASAWEVAIKISLGKLQLTGGVDGFFKICADNGIQILPVKQSHLSWVQSMPFHHHDPFDRLLLATVQTEGLTALLSADSQVYRYNVAWLW